jgi:hypothetical protein
MADIDQSPDRTWPGSYGVILQLLIEKGANINVVGDDHVDVLPAGASGAHGTAVRLLREREGGREGERERGREGERERGREGERERGREGERERGREGAMS